MFVDGFKDVGRGLVEVRTFTFADGLKVYDDYIFKTNKIVNQGRKLLISFLKNELSSWNTPQLKYMAWGSGGAAASNPFTPYAVNATDTGLVTAVVSNQSLNKVDFSPASDLKIKYVNTITNADVSSATLINEAGLFVEETASTATTKPLHLFARVTFPSVQLQPAVSSGIEITWIVDFSNP